MGFQYDLVKISEVAYFLGHLYSLLAGQLA